MISGRIALLVPATCNATTRDPTRISAAMIYIERSKLLAAAATRTILEKLKESMASIGTRADAKRYRKCGSYSKRHIGTSHQMPQMGSDHKNMRGAPF